LKNSFRKIEKLKAMIIDAGSAAMIEVDGVLILIMQAGWLKAGTMFLVAGKYDLFIS